MLGLMTAYARLDIKVELSALLAEGLFRAYPRSYFVLSIAFLTLPVFDVFCSSSLHTA